MADRMTSSAGDTLTALLLVDVQLAFNDIAFWGRRNNADAEDKCGTLLACFRQTGNPVFHIGHHSIHKDSPLCRGTPGTAFMPQVQPADGEAVLEKEVNSAFIGPLREPALLVRPASRQRYRCY